MVGLDGVVGPDGGFSGGLEFSQGDLMGSSGNAEFMLGLFSVGLGLSAGSLSRFMVSFSFLLSFDSSCVGLLGSSKSILPDVSLMEGSLSLLVGFISLSFILLELLMSLLFVLLSTFLSTLLASLVQFSHHEVMGLSDNIFASFI